jgi:general secretion pathway protein N
VATRRRPVALPAAWRWAVAGGITGLLLALILFAPARWLAGAVARATSGQVILSEPRGTVWTGSAQLVVTGGAGSTDAAALPGRLDWRLRPRWNGLAAQLHAACCTPHPVGLRVRFKPAATQLTIGPAQVQWPAATLAGLGTPWNTLQFEGDLQISTQGLSVEWVEGRLAMSGRAELLAQHLSSRLSTLRPMGSYRITVSGGTASSLRLDTLEGPLQLAGSGQWVGRRLRFQGEATAAPESEAALSNLLNIIGRRSGPRSIITIG